MRYLILALAIVSISCATFRHNTIPIADKVTSLLEQVSTAADSAFDKPTRQDFAKRVMLPAINATESMRACLASGNCKGLSADLTNLSSALLIGVNEFIAKLPASNIKTILLEKINVALTFVNNLRVRISSEEVYYSVPAEISF